VDSAVERHSSSSRRISLSNNGTASGDSGLKAAWLGKQ
jgi:hypothetical protein